MNVESWEENGALCGVLGGMLAGIALPLSLRIGLYSVGEYPLKPRTLVRGAVTFTSLGVGNIL